MRLCEMLELKSTNLCFHWQSLRGSEQQLQSESCITMSVSEIMSRTVAFGRDILNAPDVDIEDLLACLSSSEVQQMVDELASDPDDKHVPPSVR